MVSDLLTSVCRGAGSCRDHKNVNQPASMLAGCFALLCLLVSRLPSAACSSLHLCRRFTLYHQPFNQCCAHKILQNILGWPPLFPKDCDGSWGLNTSRKHLQLSKRSMPSVSTSFPAAASCLQAGQIPHSQATLQHETPHSACCHTHTPPPPPQQGSILTPLAPSHSTLQWTRRS